MREVKLSTKNQIVIAREVRDALGVKAGDRLLVVPRRDIVILLRKPKKYSLEPMLHMVVLQPANPGN